VRFAPLDVRFGAGRILQPDLLVFLDPLPRGVKTPIERIPDLCVEVVSRRHAYDRITKRRMYAEAGVREMWTIIGSQRLVERWTGDGLATLEECRERLTTPLLPGFELDVRGLFER
jgi:Uma2 family endonuclease